VHEISFFDGWGSLMLSPMPPIPRFDMTALPSLATHARPEARAARRYGHATEVGESVTSVAAAPSAAAVGGARLEVSRRQSMAIDAICAQIRQCPAGDHALPVLAAKARLGVGRFGRVFKHYIGVSPHRYVSQVRVRHALTLLQSGATPLQAALASGFYDQSHLSRSMKVLGTADATPVSARGGAMPWLSKQSAFSTAREQCALSGSLAVHFHPQESLS